MKYIFILGNNPELSKVEIISVINPQKIIGQSRHFLVVESKTLDCQKLIKQLGGTIKIGIILGRQPEPGPVIGSATSSEKKFKFGFSFYEQKPSNIGMKIKGLLKEQGINARLVSSKEPALSAVIIKKEKCMDFIVVPDFFAMTCAVQDFEGFNKRDFDRPASDSLSGMLPPKLAKMMLNISAIPKNGVLLDPFCGSGTILAEALDLGIMNLIGTDLSAKAIKDTQENLNWLIKEIQIKPQQLIIKQLDAQQLSQQFNQNSIDAIVSEPYLGKPIKGNEKDATIRKIVEELELLYLKSFEQFYKILKSGARAVIVIPEWHLEQTMIKMNIFKQIEKIGFTRLDEGNLIYKREKQKVWRNITVWSR